MVSPNKLSHAISRVHVVGYPTWSSTADRQTFSNDCCFESTAVVITLALLGIQSIIETLRVHHANAMRICVLLGIAGYHCGFARSFQELIFGLLSSPWTEARNANALMKSIQPLKRTSCSRHRDRFTEQRRRCLSAQSL